MSPVTEVVGQTGLVPDDLHLDDRLRADRPLEVRMELHAGVDQGDPHAPAGQPGSPAPRQRGDPIGPDRAVGHVQVGLHGGVERDALDVRIVRQLQEGPQRHRGGVTRDGGVRRLEQTAQEIQEIQLGRAGRVVGLHDHRHRLVRRPAEERPQVAGEFGDETRHGAEQRVEGRQQLLGGRGQRAEERQLGPGLRTGHQRENQDDHAQGCRLAERAAMVCHGSLARSKTSARSGPIFEWGPTPWWTKVLQGGSRKSRRCSGAGSVGFRDGHPACGARRSR